MVALLKEMDVIRSVCKYLKTEKQYKIESSVENVYDHDVDIVATSPKLKIRLCVEAKGQTSSKTKSRRFGNEFNPNQKKDHFAKALLKSCQYLSEDKGQVAGIALPDDTVDRELVDSIIGVLEQLGISIFLVKKNKTVRMTIGNLPL